jgi:hypothetical protein
MSKRTHLYGTNENSGRYQNIEKILLHSPAHKLTYATSQLYLRLIKSVITATQIREILLRYRISPRISIKSIEK